MAKEKLDRKKALQAIPDNWLDHLLTGPTKVVGDTPFTCRVLDGVRKRIEALPLTK